MPIAMFRSLALLALVSCLAACHEREADALPGNAGLEQLGFVETEAFSGQNAWMHTNELVKMGSRPTGSEAYKTQLEYIRSQLTKNGWECKVMDFTVTNPVTGEPVHMQNLLARFGNGHDFDEMVNGIVSCHIDTKEGIPGFVGANDGASGAAVLLELSRVLAAHPDLTRKVELVFFDGEESFAPHMDDADGLYGSKYDAGRRGDKQPLWMVNLDMVGRDRMKIRIPWDTPQRIYEEYRLAIQSLNLPSSQWGVSEMPILDDHKPFLSNGVYALNIIDDFMDGDWWHTERDNMDIISPDSLETTGKVVMQLLKQLVPGDSM